MPRVRRAQQAMLVMFLFVILVFGLLAYRGEQADQRMETYAFTMCQSRVANVARTNHYLHGMIVIERHNPFRKTSPRTIVRRIALFKSALLTPPVCGKDSR